jgi:hypothetical protein
MTMTKSTDWNTEFGHTAQAGAADALAGGMGELKLDAIRTTNSMRLPFLESS